MGCTGAKEQRQVIAAESIPNDEIDTGHKLHNAIDFNEGGGDGTNAASSVGKKANTIGARSATISEKRRRSLGRGFIKRLKSYSVHLDGRAIHQCAGNDHHEGSGQDSARKGLKKVYSHNPAINTFDSENVFGIRHSSKASDVQHPSFSSLTLKGALEVARIAFYGGATPNIIQSSKNGLYEVYIYNADDTAFKMESTGSINAVSNVQTNETTLKSADISDNKIKRCCDDSFELSSPHDHTPNLSTQALCSFLSVKCDSPKLYDAELELKQLLDYDSSAAENADDIIESSDEWKVPRYSDELINEQTEASSERSIHEYETDDPKSQQAFKETSNKLQHTSEEQNWNESNDDVLERRVKGRSLRAKFASLFSRQDHQRKMSNQLEIPRERISGCLGSCAPIRNQCPLMLSAIITEHDTLLYNRMLLHYHYNNQLVNNTRYTPIPMEFEYAD
ncbi:hypothetical protein GJ496_007740 [Pomphorhynchus laevis]|nr:hypothetical protein GJ496_007740 [Pomphorhynchus laevis]